MFEGATALGGTQDDAGGEGAVLRGEGGTGEGALEGVLDMIVGARGSRKDIEGESTSR